MPSLPDLPAELLSQVFHYLTWSDFKAIRLASKALAPLAAPFLFHEVVLTPYIEDFENKFKLGTCPLLRFHVRRLWYHYESIPDHYRRSAKVRTGAFDQGKSFLNTPLQDLHVVFLCRVLTAFPNLNEFNITSRFRDCDDVTPKSSQALLRGYSTESPRYLLSSGFAPWCPGSFIRNALLAAHATSRNLVSLAIEGLELRRLLLDVDTFPLYEIYVCPELLSVQKLRLSFNFTGKDGLRAGVKFLDLLAQMVHLESLEVSVGDRVWAYWKSLDRERWRQILHPILYQILPSESYFPCLKRLLLDNFVAYHTDLFSFLQRHASTLKSLCLEDATIIPWTNGQVDGAGYMLEASWILFLEDVRACLTLEHVRLRGTLSNASDQSWDCGLKRNNISLGCRLENFVLHGGPFPDPDELDEEPSIRPWEL